jgi:hypothetical protein
VEFVRTLIRNWSKIAFGALVLLIGVPAYQEWSKKHDIEVAAQEKKAALERVGTDASIAGSIYWNAYKACSKIGISNVETCAKYEGTLLQEKAAPMLATMAVDHRVAYDKSCRKVYAKEYCDQLLNRAYYLSQSEP